MHTQSIFAIALVATASVAVAESEDRPKIYFPRQVKRGLHQYHNSYHEPSFSIEHLYRSSSVVVD